MVSPFAVTEACANSGFRASETVAGVNFRVLPFEDQTPELKVDTGTSSSWFNAISVLASRVVCVPGVKTPKASRNVSCFSFSSLILGE